MIYVASSWRNAIQPEVVSVLRERGYEVFDFRNPREGDRGFHWSEIDPNWQDWTSREYIKALDHPLAVTGLACDFDAMKRCDACVLVLPCGRSSHLEAGWFVGAGKPVFILLYDGEPELMYGMADGLCVSIQELLTDLKKAYKAGWE